MEVTNNNLTSFSGSSENSLDDGIVFTLGCFVIWLVIGGVIIDYQTNLHGF